MVFLSRGRYVARLAETRAQISLAQDLRWRAFRPARAAGQCGGQDADAFDALCDHVLIEDAGTGDIVATFRLFRLADGHRIGSTYSASHYDLSALSTHAGPLLEVGRFCVDPRRHDPDILRLALATLTQVVDTCGVRMLFGCASFPGTDPAPFRDAFALMRDRHLASERWSPAVKSPRIFRFADELARYVPDRRRALTSLPPLLRSYLALGGRVGNHAVIDEDLGTMHVFTGLEVHQVPGRRAQTLRGVA